MQNECGFLWQGSSPRSDRRIRCFADGLGTAGGGRCRAAIASTPGQRCCRCCVQWGDRHRRPPQLGDRTGAAGTKRGPTGGDDRDLGYGTSDPSGQRRQTSPADATAHCRSTVWMEPEGTDLRSAGLVLAPPGVVVHGPAYRKPLKCPSEGDEPPASAGTAPHDAASCTGLEGCGRVSRQVPQPAPSQADATSPVPARCIRWARYLR